MKSELNEPMPPDLARRIAQEFLGFRTLQLENIDQLDFREVSKIGVQRALAAAYRAGAAASGKDIPLAPASQD